MRFFQKVVQIGVAGGSVAISAVAGFMVYPAGAVLIGAAGAALAISSFLLVTVSTFSLSYQMNLKRASVKYTHMQPCLMRKLHSLDYFDVVSSYCLPSLFSALLSVLYSWLASEDDYGLTMYEIFPARSPRSNTSELEEIIDLLPRIRAGEGRSAADQSMFQLVTILITLLFSLSSGFVVGLCTRFQFLEPLRSAQVLHDESNWHIPHVVVLGTRAMATQTVGGKAGRQSQFPKSGKIEHDL